MIRKPELTFTTSNPSIIVSRLLSLKDVNILGYSRSGGVQEIQIEHVIDSPSCYRCGSLARIKERPWVRYVDLPVYGRPMILAWRKHRLACPNQWCEVGSWTQADKRIACAGCKLTTHAAKWATMQVGQGRTISEIAAELGCNWHTINSAVTLYGHALLTADRKRLNLTTAIGLDETSFVRLKHHHTSYVTTLCDVANHQIIDIIPSRNYVHVAQYLHAQPDTWKNNIAYATLDMSPTYRAVFNTTIPHAIQIADRFHVITLANRAVDTVRRRVQQHTYGHRGRKNDPLYRARRLLTRAHNTLDQATSQRLNALLALGDPNAEITITYRIKEQLRDVYTQTNPDNAHIMLDELITIATRPTMPPEAQQLGRTLKRWKPQILAYHQARLSNSISEAMNNLIKRIKRIGFGFTNFHNYRIRALLYAGKPNWRLLNTIFPTPH